MTAVAGRLHAAPGWGAREYRRSKDFSRTAIGARTPVLSSDSAVVRTWAGSENAYHRRVKAESLGPQLGEADASQQVFDFASGVAVGAAVTPGLAGRRSPGAAIERAGVAGAAEPAAVGPAGGRADEGPLAHGFAADQQWTLGRIRR